MKDKHIRVEADSQLLKKIYAEVSEKLVLPSGYVKGMIFLKGFIYGGLTLGFYVSLYFVSSSWYWILCMIAYGFSALLLAFNFAHDLSHNTVFKSRQWNNLGFVFIYTLVGAHADSWKRRHIHEHHYAPNVQAYDSDLKISGLMRLSPEAPLRWFHRFQHVYGPFAYTSYSLFWIFIKDFVLLLGEEGKTYDWKYHLTFWGQKSVYLVYLLVLPLVFAPVSTGIILTGFFLMHVFQSLFLLFTFLMTHHVEGTDYPMTDETGYIQASWIMNQVRSSNDMHPFSVLANFILGGFNNHIAHHLFPHLHHLYYPKLNRILYPILEENAVKPNATTYWGGVVSHLRLLRRMGAISEPH